MDRQEWNQIIEKLRGEDIDQAVKAIETLDQKADPSDLPELYLLLEDPSFFVREAAAYPLARLEGAKALERLFVALNRGQKDGHDNDSLTSVIADLLEKYPTEVLPIILRLMVSQEKQDRKNAAWAMGFLHRVASPQPLLELLKKEGDPGVQSAAIGSLSSFNKDEEVFQILLAWLDSGYEQTRIEAAASLAYFGDKRAIGPLKQALYRGSKREKDILQYALKILEAKRNKWQAFHQ